MRASSLPIAQWENHFSTGIRPVTRAASTSPRNQFRENIAHPSRGHLYVLGGPRFFCVPSPGQGAGGCRAAVGMHSKCLVVIMVERA